MELKRLHMIFVGIALLFFTVTKAQTYTLENSSVSFKTDGKHVISIFDKDRSIEHVTSDYSSAGGVFGVSYVNANTLSSIGVVNSGSITDVTLVESTETSLSFLLENSLLSSIVDVSLSESEPGVIYSISVQMKNSNHFVSQVDFPRVRISRKQGAETKKFLEPDGEGILRSIETEVAWFRSYPGKQSVQMGSYLASGGSIMLWADDTKGHVKSFGFKKNGTSANIAIRHLIPHDNSTWDPGFSCRVSVFGGDWQDGADIYRNWARQQHWSHTLLKDRTDVPGIIHQRALAISSQLDKESLSGLPAKLLEWQQMYGANIIYRPLGWEKYGNWVGIDYFPVSVGDNAYKTLNQSLKTNGIITSGFIEGYHWTKRLTDASAEINNELETYFNANAPSLVRTDFDGSIIFDNNANRHEAFVCRGTEFGRDFFQGVAYKLFDLGVTQIHNDFDQLMGKEGPCWNKSHGHPVPYGTWEIDTMRQVYTEIAAEAKKRNIENFFMTREYPQEVFNMLLQGGQERNFKIYADKPNLVPLRHYIYHEFIPAIFGLTNANASADILTCSSILLGQIPSIAFWNNTVKSPQNNNTAKVLKDYFASLDIYSRPYLLYGIMQKPILNDSEDFISQTWNDHSGNTGVFSVNLSGVDKTVDIVAPGIGPLVLKIYEGKDLKEVKDIAGGETLSWDVAPWRLAAMVFSVDEVVYPYAVAGEDVVVNVLPDSIVFNGQGFDDQEIVSYSWTKISGGQCDLFQQDSAQLIVKGFDEGTYTFRLTVRNSKGETASDDVSLTYLCAACRTPFVTVNGNRIVGLPIDTVQINASATVQLGEIEHYVWEKIAGNDVSLSGTNTQQLIVSDLSQGDYIFRVSVESDSGFTASADVEVKVLPLPDSIAYTRGSINVDGEQEALWCGTEYALNEQVLGFSNHTATATFLWDTDSLFVYISVKDEFLMHDSGDDWWNDDAVEIFIDGINAKQPLYTESDFRFGFRWHWDPQQHDAYETVHGSVDGVNWAIKEVTGGFNLEAAFSWSALNVSPSANARIGLEVRIDSDDDGGNQDAVKALFGYSGSSIPMPSQFGTFTLGRSSCTNLSLGSNQNLPEISILPTISRGIYNINSIYNHTFAYEVYDVSGSVLTIGQFTGKATLDLTGLSSGIYFIRIQNCKPGIFKLVKQ